MFAKSLAEAAAGELEGEGLTRRRGEAESAEEVANEITNPCPKCHRQMSADGTCSFCEGTAKDFHNKPAADKADAPEDSGSSGAPAEAANYTRATAEKVEKFKTELPKDISPAEFDAILTTGFEDTDGEGNKVKYGTLLRDHINDGSRNDEDRDARKKRLGDIVRIVRETRPVPTSRSGGKERVYAGHIGDKAYAAVADEHNEIGAFVMVSYRRDGKHDKK